MYREALSVIAPADERTPPVEYDDAREETGEETSDDGAPLASGAGSAGSGMHLDVCTRCTGCTMVDPHTLLCVPCEEDVDGMESDGDAEL